MSVICKSSSSTETSRDSTVSHTPKRPSATTVVTCPPSPPECAPRRAPAVEMRRKSKCSSPKPSLEAMVHMVNLAWPDGARPIDARWQIARALVGKRGTRRFFRRVLDSYVEDAVKYIKSLDACRTENDLDRLGKRMPHLHAARLLREGDDMLGRGLVEARLLAGMSIEQTAAACNLPAETIEWYEALFFRVIGYLKHRIYIANHAFGMRYCADPTEDEVDVLLKRAGFLGGPSVVDRFERYYAFDWTIVSSIPALSVDQLIELTTMITIKTLILAWVLPFEQAHRVYKLSALSDELRSMINVLRTQSVGDQAPVLDLSPLNMDDLLGVGSPSQDCPASDVPVDAVA